jgi:hypothetical protein
VFYYDTRRAASENFRPKRGVCLSKNWSIVRKVIGYDRYEGVEALAHLNRVYDVLRLWTNHWQPVMKPIAKERVGAKLRKHYDVARTPYKP